MLTSGGCKSLTKVSFNCEFHLDMLYGSQNDGAKVVIRRGK